MNLVSRKICLIGDFGVGKTSLIRRFVDRQFSEQYLTTVGVNIARKAVEVPREKIQLLIWDVEGQTKFKAITPSYLQGAKGAIIVADLVRPETIEHLVSHLDLFATVNSKAAKVIVAFNKADLVADASLNKFRQNLCAKHSQVIGTYVTSAKTSKNVDEIFYRLACSLVE